MPRKTVLVVHHWGVSTQGMNANKERETAVTISKQKHTYNAQILRDGSIYQVNQSWLAYGHALNQKLPGGDDWYNLNGFGVAFAGDMTKETLTSNQKYAFWSLYFRLCDEMSNTLKIMMHREITHTACPGNINMMQLDRANFGEGKAERLTRDEKFKLVKACGWVPLRMIEKQGQLEVVAWDMWTKEPTVRWFKNVVN